METIDLQTADGVARMTLNRPNAGNSMNLKFGEDFRAAAEQIAADSSVRAILLTGAGKLFCGGGDVAEFAAADDTPGLIRALLENLHAGIVTLAEQSAPLVVAVNGTAAGAGLSLAAAGDLVLAASSAKFTAAYTGIGLSPDGSMTWYLPQLIGLRRTQELMLTNRVLSAEEAADWGLVTRVVQDEELVAEADKLAARIAAGPTAAFGSVRALLRSSTSQGLAAQLSDEAREIVANAGRDDGVEGIASFVEKRKPAFRGR